MFNVSNEAVFIVRGKKGLPTEFFRSLPKILGSCTELGSPSRPTFEDVFINEAAAEAVCSLLCNSLNLCILALFKKGHILHSILWCFIQVLPVYPDFFLSFGIIKLTLSLNASFVVSTGEFGGFGGECQKVFISRYFQLNVV